MNPKTEITSAAGGLSEDRYYTLTLDVPDWSADLFSGVLFQLGARGIESVPSEGLMHFPDVEPPRPGTERMIATFREADAETRAAIERTVTRHLAEVLAQTPPETGSGEASSWPELSVAEVPEQDWSRIWRSLFHPMRIGQHLVIRPSWEGTEIGPEDVELVIDPGLAFGTGSHETTRMCLEWIERHAAGQRVLDLGTGTGILALVAVRAGARRVVATDNDPEALVVADENLARNGARDEVELSDRPPSALGEVFDRIVANIIPDPLIALAPEVVAALAPGGELALSGLLLEHRDQVSAAYQAQGLVEIGRQCEGEWALLHLRKPETAL